MLMFFNREKSVKSPSSEAVHSLQLVRNYWESLRHDGRLPQRCDIDPRGFSGVLERVFLIERIALGQARFRLSGMHLHDLLGMDARGMPLGAFFEPVARTRISEVLEQVFSDSTILTLHLEAERSLGQPKLQGLMQILPLSTENGAKPLALGCLVSDGKVGRSPRRFAIAEMRKERIELPAKPAPSNPAPQILRPIAAARPALRLVSSRD
jgi:hypothetical protein